MLCRQLVFIAMVTCATSEEHGGRRVDYDYQARPPSTRQDGDYKATEYLPPKSYENDRKE